MADLLDIVENTEDICLFAMDETGIRLESKNHYSWSPKGKPTIIEQNGCKKGLNIIGATEISKDFSMFTKAYSSVNSITAQEIVYFLQDLIEAYPNKTLMVIWDNARTHTAQIVRDFAALHEDKLHLIFQPPYSPQLNPQENIWKWFKDECAQSNAYKNEKELQHRTDEFFSHANSHPQEVKIHAWARSFYK
jgi:transposase